MQSLKLRFPTDLLLLFIPTAMAFFIALAIAVAVRLSMVTLNEWRGLFQIAVSAALLGISLLGFAKSAQWRIGILWKFGYHGTSRIHGLLYKIAWLVIGAAMLTLLILLALARIVR